MGPDLATHAMTGERAEVVVVGGGPAGSALALRLARAGRDVLVLEAGRFPRDKPCGDFVNPGAVLELERLGVAADLLARCRPRPIRRWRVEAPDGGAFEAQLGSVGWAVRRRELDDSLLQVAVAAGARVRFGVRVYDLLYRDGRVVGVMAREGSERRTFAARVVVGADGLRSVVQRRLELALRPPRIRKIALVGHLERDGVEPGRGSLRVGGPGVCGFAPLPGGANVTLVVPATEAPRISGDPAGYLSARLRSFPDVAERVAAGGLERRVMVTGPFDRPVRRPWAPGAVLVGDAAGYYDPFTGQGIYRALRSAAAAADAVERVLRSSDPDRGVAFDAYDRQVGREFDPGRRVQRLLESILSRPPVLCAFVRALSTEPEAATRLLRVTGDLDRAARLLRSGFWSRLIRGWMLANRRNRHRP